MDAPSAVSQKVRMHFRVIPMAVVTVGSSKFRRFLLGCVVWVNKKRC
jgi:hypothetical protein